MIEFKNISKGKRKGELIISSEPPNIIGGINPDNGEIINTIMN